MSIIIRQVTDEDLSVLCEIERESFTIEAFTKEQIAYLLKAHNGVSLVAQIDGEIAGFIISSIYQHDERRVGHIYTIDVLTKHRRRRVASKLLGELEKIFKRRGVKACYLEVRTNNVAARELYQKQGYKKVEQLKDYYGKGVHGLQLKKNLL